LLFTDLLDRYFDHKRGGATDRGDEGDLRRLAGASSLKPRVFANAVNAQFPTAAARPDGHAIDGATT
jgi:hypothetical protein